MRSGADPGSRTSTLLPYAILPQPESSPIVYWSYEAAMHVEWSMTACTPPLLCKGAGILATVICSEWRVTSGA
jgi:hypothetical protein